MSIFRLKIHIFTLKIHIFTLKMSIFSLKIELRTVDREILSGVLPLCGRLLAAEHRTTNGNDLGRM